MKSYTITEACAELRYNRVTLERRMRKLAIAAQQGSIDKRERYITQSDIDKIRNTYATIEQRRITVAHPSRNAGLSRAALLARIAELEAELARYRVARSVVAAPRKPRDPSASGNNAKKRGIGRRYAGLLAHSHGANSVMSATDWEWRDEDLASDVAALAFIEQYLAGHPRAGTWRSQCDQRECVCQHERVGDEARLVLA